MVEIITRSVYSGLGDTIRAKGFPQPYQSEWQAN